LKAGATTGSAPDPGRLEAVEAKIDALCGAVEDIRQMVGAVSKPESANGAAHRKPARARH
jgi:hypothetical protein